MKVMYIGGFELPDRNAAAHRVVAIAKSLRSCGHEVKFIGVTKNKEEAWNNYCFEGFNYTLVPYPDNMLMWLKQIAKFIPLSIIDSFKPDVVILYNLYSLAQKRIIQHCHNKSIKVLGDITEWYSGSGFSIHQIIRRIDISLRMRKFNCQLDGIIAISRYLYDFYKSLVPTIYIPPTVDYSNKKFGRDRALEVHNPIRLIFAGSISSDKDSLSEIVQLVKDDLRFHLDIIGVDKQSFLKINKIQPIESDNIKFHGRVSHHQAISTLKKSDFQLIIRKENLVTKAGFPTKFVESLSCGIPVIATPTSNICDYLSNGANGFVIDDKQSLKECLDVIRNMTDHELLMMKKRALNVTSFAYDNYIEELNLLLKHK